MKIELTEEQIKSVLILISRAEIKGSEAVGVVMLQQVFSKAIQKLNTQTEKKESDRIEEK